MIIACKYFSIKPFFQVTKENSLDTKFDAYSGWGTNSNFSNFNSLIFNYHNRCVNWCIVLMKQIFFFSVWLISSYKYCNKFQWHVAQMFSKGLYVPYLFSLTYPLLLVKFQVSTFIAISKISPLYISIFSQLCSITRWYKTKNSIELSK